MMMIVTVDAGATAYITAGSNYCTENGDCSFSGFLLRNPNDVYSEFDMETDKGKLPHEKSQEPQDNSIMPKNLAPFPASNVAFYVWQDDDISTTTGVVYFDQIVVNNGAAFDMTSSTFTAPQNGAYVFALYLKPESNEKTHIVHESNIKLTVRGDSEEYSSASSVIIYMAAGEEVWSEKTAGIIQCYGSLVRCGFSGFLLG